MSFICDECGEVSLPRHKQYTIVVQSRPTEYLNYKQTEDGMEAIISHGYETVSEVKVCEKCYKFISWAMEHQEDEEDDK